MSFAFIRKYRVPYSLACIAGVLGLLSGHFWPHSVTMKAVETVVIWLELIALVVISRRTRNAELLSGSRVDHALPF
jgi:hypothetical protein